MTRQCTKNSHPDGALSEENVQSMFNNVTMMMHIMTANNTNCYQLFSLKEKNLEKIQVGILVQITINTQFVLSLTNKVI